MRNGFSARLLNRSTYPTNGIIIVRCLLAQLAALPLVALVANELLSPVINLLVFSVSCLLQWAGVHHTRYKWLLTVDGRAIYITGEIQLVLISIVLVSSLLWIKGRMIPKLPYITGGIGLFYLVHVFTLFTGIVVTDCPIPAGGGNSSLGINYVLCFVLVKLYVQQHLVKQAA